MKKLLSLLLFTFLIIKTFAQLDTEHWFAPMMDRVDNGDEVQTIYFSTNVTTPFPVTIYNNNLAIGTVTVSKGNPQKFSVPRPFIITIDDTKLFKPTTMGIYTKGDQPYFANLRFSIYNHAEILTSKGIAGIGKTFFVAMAPITVSNGILNFMTGILATEDNTKVTVSGYQPNVAFSIAQGSSFTFTLNKGESYIIDGKGSNFNNQTGFIGAKIVADKPISVTNGNFNGQYAGNYSSSSDILMDQSVPVDRLGSEFALVKGNGPIGDKMEGGLIIATQNNTQIYVNNIAAPVATLNEGQYYRLPETFYTNQGGGVFNMYVKSTKNVYLYQLLAGASTGNVEATGGFNYIPPLSCYLPKEIDEIGLINENLTYSYDYIGGQLNIPTKLNIITESGATVTVNGVTPNVSQGPYPLVGNASWVTYSIEDVSGNITVVSSKAVTAGIAAGDGAVGYGGYFAGFSSIPAIVKESGSCLPNLVLKVTSGFTTYQWQLNGTNISGANSSTFTPSVPGNYTVIVSSVSCPPVTTSPVTVLNCTKLTTLTKSACSAFTITPSFTRSTQNIVKSTIQIKTPPTQGTATINPTTGEITYTPNPGAVGTDSFIYSFCGDGTFQDCEEITVNITNGQLAVSNETLTSCKVGTTGIFNLSSANITANSPVTKKYYKTPEGAQNETPADEITNFTTFPSTGGDVYVVIKTPEGCSDIATISLKLFPEIILDTSLYNSVNCDDNFDGKIDVDFSTITPLILQNSTYFQVRYYLSLSEANAGTTTGLGNNYSYSSNTSIFVRVDSPDNCPPFKTAEIDLKIGTSLTLNQTTYTASPECDDDFDGIKSVDLTKYLSEFTSASGVSVSYYNNLQNAQKSQNAISNPVSVNKSGTYYLRLSEADYCPVIATLNISINIPTASSILQDKNICPGRTTVLDAGIGFTYYKWKKENGEIIAEGPNVSSIENIPVGKYKVELTSGNTCISEQNVEVKEVELPVITAIDIQGSTVTITVEGGNKPYYYSLNGLLSPTSNVFTNVQSGINTILVTSADQCDPVSKEFFLIKISNVITPNGDNKNDTFDYSDLQNKDNPKFEIYDRYGKLIFTGTKTNNYTWDGTSNLRKLSTDSYWYVLEWQEFGTPTTVKQSGWVLLKNY